MINAVRPHQFLCGTKGNLDLPSQKLGSVEVPQPYLFRFGVHKGKVIIKSVRRAEGEGRIVPLKGRNEAPGKRGEKMEH